MKFTNWENIQWTFILGKGCDIYWSVLKVNIIIDAKGTEIVTQMWFWSSNLGFLNCACDMGDYSGDLGKTIVWFPRNK